MEMGKQTLMNRDHFIVSVKCSKDVIVMPMVMVISSLWKRGGRSGGPDKKTVLRVIELQRQFNPRRYRVYLVHEEQVKAEISSTSRSDPTCDALLKLLILPASASHSCAESSPHLVIRLSCSR